MRKRMWRFIIVGLLAVYCLAACTDGDSIRRKEREPLQVTGLTPSAPPHIPAAGVEPDQTIIAGNDDQTPQQPQKSPMIIRGSGATIGSLPSEMASLGDDVGDVTLNFVDADVKDVVKSVLGDILGRTYTIAPGVSGKVTLKTNSPLTRAELIPTLESILQDRGIAIVVHNGSYAIVLVSDIKQPPIVSANDAAGYGSQVVRLRHIASAEMVKILEQYASTGLVRSVGTAPNLIILTGSQPERANLNDIVAMFDVDRFSGMSFGIFPVSAADPETIIAELTKIFAPAIGSPNMKGMLEFVPINRQSSVLVISSDSSRIDQVGMWIAKLDKGEIEDQPELYVHYVQHGDAKQIAEVLRDIFGANETAEQAPTGPTGATIPGAQQQDSFSKPSDTSGFAATAPTEKPSFDASATADQGDTPPVDQPGGAGLATPSSPTINSSTSTVPQNDGKARIIADQANNALFILATPKKYKLIGAAIKHLDVAPMQVLIEATIAEVTLNDQLKYGVEWFFQTGHNSFGFSDLASGAVTSSFPGFSYLFNSNDAKIVLNALDKITEVKVISSPQLMVLDNKTAKLQVGDQVPITTQSAVTVDNPGAPIVNSVEFKDTGVILTVKPRVNNSGSVEMDIEQEVSDVVPTTTSNIDSPTIQQRKIKSAVTVQDGQTIALGGLIRDNQKKGTTGIPVIKDIPVLGNLFKTNDNQGDRTELLVLITPRVVRDPNDAKELTDELRRRLQAVTPLNQKIQ